MSAIKRAILYLSRKKARTVILLLILFAMGLLMLVGLSVRDSAEKAIADVKATYATSFTLAVNDDVTMDMLFERTRNEQGEIVRKAKKNLLSESELNELISDNNVMGFYIPQGMALQCYTGLELTKGVGYAALAETLENPFADAEQQEQVVKEVTMGTQSNGFMPIAQTEWAPMFQNGALELAEGRHLERQDTGKAIISNVLAQNNDLKLGDSITAQCCDYTTGELYGTTYDTQIIGIFKMNFEQDLSGWTSEADILENRIFVSTDMNQWEDSEFRKKYGFEAFAENSDPVYDAVTVYLKDTSLLDETIDSIATTNIVDWNYYHITQNDEDYKVAAASLQLISNIATALIVLMIMGGFIVLSLILTLWTKTRRKEIGVLSSIGLKKRNVLLQFFIECLLVCMIAFVLAGVASIPITDAIGGALEDTLFMQDNTEPYKTDYNMQTREIKVYKASTEKIELVYSLHGDQVLLMLAALTSICCLSAAIAVQSIIKLKPREILLLR